MGLSDWNHAFGEPGARLGPVLLVIAPLLFAAAAIWVTSPVAGAPAPPSLSAVCAIAQPGDVPPQRSARLARGYNLTGWVDRDQTKPPDIKLLARLKSLGFTHVRLPVYGEAVMPAFTSKEDADRRLGLIDHAVSLLLGLGYGVIVDMHPGSRFKALHEDDPDRAYEQLQEAWRLLATRLAKEDPDAVFFELLNEPSAPQSVWGPQATKLASFVRSIAPNHTLIVGPAGSQNVAALAALAPLDLPNVVYAVHFYEPLEFTHQGLDWGGDDNPLGLLKGVPYPLRASDPSARALLGELEVANETEAASRLRGAMDENWDDARVGAALAPVADWAVRNRKPVIIDEFGVLARYADPSDRARWLEAVRNVAERDCFGWTHWEFAEWFGLLNEEGTDIDPVIENALLGARAR